LLRTITGAAVSGSMPVVNSVVCATALAATSRTPPHGRCTTSM
jgi:hypothetical protein